MMDNAEDFLHKYRARRLRFLINGDKFFNGINYALNRKRISSLDALLNDLTRVLMDNIKLCKGVRYIFNLEGRLVSELDGFQDGNTYICSSIETFVLTDYRVNNGMRNWLVRNSACISTKRRILNSTINSSIAQHNQSIATPSSTPNSKLFSSTPAKYASHNNHSNSKSSDSNNHIKSCPSPKAPITSNNALISTSSKRTPKKAVDSNSSQNNKNSNTPHIKNSAANDNHYHPKTISPAPKQNGASNHVTEDTTTSPGKVLTFGPDVVRKYDIGRPIGDGHFSIVYCCMNKTSHEFYALKLIDKLKCQGRDDMIYNEIKILKQLDHPNIVKLIEEFDYDKQLYLILELVQDGDLFDAISTVTKFDEVHVATMIHNLSSALSYLHGQGIVHRDIKPENLLISVQEDGSQSLKLADFGLAVEVGDNLLYSVCGTAFYVSPEMLNETGYDYKVDVWSTGVICFILLSGYPPFTSENESNQDELFDAILAGDFEFSPSYWSKISLHAKNLIKSMLTVDPKERYTAEQVFKHPWTNGISSNFEGVNPMNMSRRVALQLSQ